MIWQNLPVKPSEPVAFLSDRDAWNVHPCYGFAPGPFPQRPILLGILFFRIKQLFCKSLECVKIKHPFKQHAGLCLEVPHWGCVGHVWLRVQSAHAFPTSYSSWGSSFGPHLSTSSILSFGLCLSPRTVGQHFCLNLSLKMLPWGMPHHPGSRPLWVDRSHVIPCHRPLGPTLPLSSLLLSPSALLASLVTSHFRWAPQVRPKLASEPAPKFTTPSWSLNPAETFQPHFTYPLGNFEHFWPPLLLERLFSFSFLLVFPTSLDTQPRFPFQCLLQVCP